MELGLPFRVSLWGRLGTSLGQEVSEGRQGPSTAGRDPGAPVRRAEGSQGCCLGCRGGAGAVLPGAEIFLISYCCCFQEFSLDFIIKLIKNTFFEKKGQRAPFRASHLGEAGSGPSGGPACGTAPTQSPVGGTEVSEAG